ncbi:Fe-S cluster assembly sulfur transfer protein SufU [Lactobacillus mulieris]|jgi:SUF system feS assembly protein, nifU family|uniref:SUF system NifU family Fe-S cluster assembly protein n=1 Tax=Lactobacillus mulieris TaxID=2508708 RepID=A0AAP3GUX9_9LACO|nr:MULTISPECIES: SUF system NifU family Fe-S cluster assembly protein [Lactobacillus]EEU21587.1 NifU family SUF system FeS assembly protein [Lactobacillus jensenii 27-2-CHN]EEX24459.1 SUF system FeS assembly protein, NifU family [Lactobacillus jensenii 115-3-CHN]EFH29632.1 SUF system FeS assembly protein, NifU family [Lactobacillus jensenii JV-V16]KAA9244871.1 SUF system NifU family Fe-S cluster assembly protein [Lactobacillus jensenii]KAA9367524.1 SUF system NifU family Fe-S cluster assembly 
MSFNLTDLYRESIVEAAQAPRHHGQLKKKNATVELHNPSCGDVLVLDGYFENNKLVDMAFSGYGCTISQASASLMTDQVLGQEISEIKDEVMLFSNLITDKLNQAEKDRLGDCIMLEGVKEFPARIKCATLAWKAIYQLIENYEGQK